MKKGFLPLVSILALLLGLTACAGAEGETRYILTEFETTVGSTVQKTVHHYKEDWTLTGSTVYRDGQTDMEIVYEHNEHGDVTSIICTTADLSQREEHICSYDDRGNLVRSEVYLDGALTASTVTEYDYDPKGVLVSMVQHSGGHTYAYSYNPDGTVAEMVYTSEEWDIHQTTLYTYDEHGNEIRSETRNAAGTLIMETNSSYDKDGRIRVSVDTRYHEDGTPAESTATEYTWDGLVKTTHAMDASGKEVGRTVTQYDEAGNTLRLEIYHGDDLMSTQVMTYRKVEVPAK